MPMRLCFWFSVFVSRVTLNVLGGFAFLQVNFGPEPLIWIQEFSTVRKVKLMKNQETSSWCSQENQCGSVYAGNRRSFQPCSSLMQPTRHVSGLLLLVDTACCYRGDQSQSDIRVLLVLSSACAADALESEVIKRQHESMLLLPNTSTYDKQTNLFLLSAHQVSHSLPLTPQCL